MEASRDRASVPTGEVIIPESMDEFIIPPYSRGVAEDPATGVRLGGAIFGGYFGASAVWLLTKRKSIRSCIARLCGYYDSGRQFGFPNRIAVVITHSHLDSFFPFRDSVYSDELRLEKFASLLQTAERAAAKKRKRTKIVVVDDREAYRAANSKLACQEKESEIRFRNWRTISDGEANRLPGAVGPLASYLIENDPPTIMGDPFPARFTREQADFHDLHTGLNLSISSAGDRDYHYYRGWLHEHGSRIAELAIHSAECWRPGYGPCRLINLNHAYLPKEDFRLREREDLYEEDLTFERIAPLLNHHPLLFAGGKHLGQAVLIDTRANPIRYYYG